MLKKEISVEALKRAYNSGDDTVKETLENLFGVTIFLGSFRDRVKSLEDVLSKVGDDDPATLYPNVPNHAVNYMRACLISKAYNGNWIADYKDPNQPKYFVWLYCKDAYYGGSANTVEVSSANAPSGSYASQSSHLAFSTREDSMHAGKLFQEIYEAFLL